MSLSATLGRLAAVALAVVGFAAATGVAVGTPSAHAAPLAFPPGTVVKLCQAFCDDDKDGVPNAADKCPNTTAGVKVNADGCVPLLIDAGAIAKVDPGAKVKVCVVLCDDDKDGVKNADDKCPNTPAGTAVDATGCPPAAKPADADGDGVPDSTDQCPATASGAAVDAGGCSAAQKAPA